MLSKIGGFFHKKVQKKGKTHAMNGLDIISPIKDSAPPARLSMRRNPKDGKLASKRQSMTSATKIHRSPTPLLSPTQTQASEWRPSPLDNSSQVVLTPTSRIPAPTFFVNRSVSPMSDAAVTPTPASRPVPQLVSGQSKEPKADIVPAADGSNQATVDLCDRLVNQCHTEKDSRRKNKMLALVTVSKRKNKVSRTVLTALQALHGSLVNARDAARCAAQAAQAASEAAAATVLNEKLLITLQTRATRLIRKQ